MSTTDRLEKRAFSSTDPLRVGLIGSGMMGFEHIRNLALQDDLHFAALADPNPPSRKLGRKTAKHRIAEYEDASEMLDQESLDAVIIASPNFTHAAVLDEVLDRPLHVLVEKPLCTTLEDCDRVVAACVDRPAITWVGMEYRYMPPVQRVLAEIGQGTAGRPVMMAIREHRFPFLEKIGNWNRFSRRTGGTLVEKCCHFWDLMRLVLRANPVRVYASGAMDVNHMDERYDGMAADIIDNAFVTVEFDNGARGMLDLCMFAEGSYWQEVISVTGPMARIDACVPGPARFAPDGKQRVSRIVISDRASKQERAEDVHVDAGILAAGDHHGSTYFQHKRFLDLVRAGHGQPEVTAEDGLWSVMVGVAAEQSALMRQAIEIEGL